MKRNILAENMRRFNTKNLNEEKLEESSFITKLLRKIGWAGEWSSPEELASQIKDLPDAVLIAWSKDKNGIPNTPLHFQQKLVKIEMDNRGLSSESQDGDMNNNGYPDYAEE